jgi:HEAT repeat protein
VLQVLRRAAAGSDQPVVRQAALAALGRVADSKAVDAAVSALSARTKTVQLTAAWALREIASRRGAGRAQITRALSSSDRARWAATRVFNQHFRELTKDSGMMEALVRNLDDPVPQVRYQAAAGLWRWYCWQVDKEAVCTSGRK